MTNTELYNLHENIANLINESNIPCTAVYFVVKDIMRDLEKNVFKSLEIEKGATDE